MTNFETHQIRRALDWLNRARDHAAAEQFDLAAECLGVAESHLDLLPSGTAE